MTRHAAQKRASKIEPGDAVPPSIGMTDQDRWVLYGLGAMMALLPAAGVTHEALLQDTLKSALVAFIALGLGLVFFLRRVRGAHQAAGYRWHAVLWLPLLLLAASLISMAWSHTYLAGVEAVRWGLFTLLSWIALNVVTVTRMQVFATLVHVGAFMAALWGALQFWFDLSWFPQGPNPASTFVNRNFAAEWVVVAFPLSVWALFHLKHTVVIILMAFSLALNITFLCMTGTRSALLSLALLLCLLPWVVWRFWPQLPLSRWPGRVRWLALIIFATSLINLGLMPSSNPRILSENQVSAGHFSAFQRAYQRSGSVLKREEYTQHSFSVRLTMWRATWSMIKARPWVGVGAGAWEVDIPLYQDAGTQLETDYYAHNEYLQLIGEFGLVGWVFLLGLGVFFLRQLIPLGRPLAELGQAGDSKAAESDAVKVWRVALLLSLAALLVVSAAGFPWRLATTGAMFALCLGLLAGLQAPDAQPRAGVHRWVGGPWTLPANLTRPLASWGAAACLGGLLLASFITWQAARCERLIIEAVKIALTISASGQPDHPRWAQAKRQMLDMLEEGIAINPHYRKITPMAADELARWGDWRNAVWVWESVITSRPYVLAILTNIARGYSQTGQAAAAQEFLERAKALQPRAPAVISLEVILLTRANKVQEAAELARKSMQDNTYDLDLLNAAIRMSTLVNDEDLALEALKKRNARWPRYAVDGWFKLGQLHASGQKHRNDTLAALAFAEALRLAGPAARADILSHIPDHLRSQVEALAPAISTDLPKH